MDKPTNNIFAAYETKDSRATNKLIDKAIKTCEEDDESIITQIMSEIASDDTDESVMLLSKYRAANNHDKAVIDHTLVNITGWTLKTLIKKMLGVENEE